MTFDPDFTVTIPRLLLPGSLDPLVLSGMDDENPLGVVEYTRPPKTPRLTQISDDHLHSDFPIRWSFQQSILAFSVAPDANNAATAQALLHALEGAIHQGLRFPVTTQESDADAETWTCHPGSLIETSRSLPDLMHHDPLWVCALPCHPVPTIA